jgi:hypothetical protein
LLSETACGQRGIKKHQNNLKKHQKKNFKKPGIGIYLATLEAGSYPSHLEPDVAPSVSRKTSRIADMASMGCLVCSKFLRTQHCIKALPKQAIAIRAAMSGSFSWYQARIDLSNSHVRFLFIVSGTHRSV